MHGTPKTGTGEGKKAEGKKRQYTKRKSAHADVVDQDLNKAGTGSKSKKHALELPTTISDKKEGKVCETEPAAKKPRRSGRLSNGTT